MAVLWFILAAAAALTLAALPRWQAWTSSRRRLHIVLGLVASLSLGIMTHVFLGELIDAGEPVLARDYGWLILLVAIVLVSIILVISALPWRGHLPWLVLAPPVFLMMLDLPYATGYGRGVSGMDILMHLALLAWLAMVPWALPAALARWGRWDGKAQTVVASLFLLYSTLPIVTEGIWAPYGPQAGTSSFTVNVTAEGEYAMLVSGMLGGPFEGFTEDPGKIATLTGDIHVEDGPGGIWIHGTGNGTVRLAITFYGATGDQEWRQTGDIRIRDHEGVPVMVNIDMDIAAPYCHFVESWSGEVTGETTLRRGEGYGECS